MIESSKNIKACLRKFFGVHKRQLWMKDREFYLLHSKELLEIVKICSVAHLKPIPGLRECEEFAANLEVKIRNYQADCYECSSPGKKHVNWCVGVCDGTLFMGFRKKHTVNIAVCQDGYFLIEPQNDTVWKADNRRDKLYKIEII